MNARLAILAACSIGLLALASVDRGTATEPSGIPSPHKSWVESDARSSAQTVTAQSDDISIQFGIDDTTLKTGESLVTRIVITNLDEETFHSDSLLLGFEVLEAGSNDFIAGVRTPQTYFKSPPPLTLASGESTTTTFALHEGWGTGAAHIEAMPQTIEAEVSCLTWLLRVPPLRVRIVNP